MIRSVVSRGAVSVTSEAKIQLFYGLQICWSYLLKKSLDVTSLSFVGHLGQLYLSAAGLALVTANVTGNAVLLGLGGAQSTLCSQANGAGDASTMNAVFQRAIIVSLCTCIPISVLWLCAEGVLRQLGQEDELAAHAAAFLAWLIPGLFFFSQSLCIQNWLFSQQKMTAPAIVISIVAILHVLWNYLFVVVLNMGYLGTAVAITVSRLVELLLLMSYVCCSDVLRETHFSWSTRCLEDWVPLFALFYGNVMMMSELWASEVLTFLSGTIANAHVEVAAMSIYQSINAFCFQFSNGIQAVACARVGNLLGAGSSESAKTAAKVAASISFALTLCVSASLFFMGRYYIMVYTNDEGVVDATLLLMPVLALYVVGDGTVAALSGVIKGLGKQKIGGRIVVFSYYVIAIPISVLLAYHWGGSFDFGLGTLGLCLGTLAGTYSHCFLYVLYIFCICNWEQEVKLAESRVEQLARHAKMTAAPTRTYSRHSYEIDDLYEHSFVGMLFKAVERLFAYVPFIELESEAKIRNCEYELVQAYTADLEETDVLEDDGVDIYP